MARPPKPVEQHIIDGSYRKDRHSDRGVSFDRIENINPPEILSDAAKEMWKVVVPGLCSRSLVTQIDLPVLQDAFMCYGAAQDCWAKALENKTPADYLKSLQPKEDVNLLTQYRIFMDRFLKIMYKFGVTPVERARIRGIKQESKQKPNAAQKLAQMGRG